MYTKILASLFLTFCLTFTCYASSSLSYTATVGTSYTLVANLDALSIKYQGIQILNPSAVKVDCAKSSGASSPTLTLPTGFTSITLQNFFPYGTYYCKVDSGTTDVTINVWQLRGQQ